jgi:hypothetical protein
MLVQVPPIRAVTDSTGVDPKVWMMMQSYTDIMTPVTNYQRFAEKD